VILWLDAQLSPALATWIMARWPHIQAVPVRNLGLKDAEDRDILSAGAVVMTKDRDFLALLFMQGPPPQVIWLRVVRGDNEVRGRLRS